MNEQFRLCDPVSQPDAGIVFNDRFLVRTDADIKFSGAVMLPDFGSGGKNCSDRFAEMDEPFPICFFNF